jgi:molecular chaperone GrpE (heat shock protein)
MKCEWLGLAILLLLPVNSVFACPPQSLQYQDDQNVVDAARRAREQKKEQPKATRVWDNDSIPKKPGEVSVIGQTPAAAEGDDSAATAGTKNAAAAASDKTENPANESASATPAPATAPASGGGSGAAASEEKTEGSKASAEIAAIQSDLASARAQLQTAKADLDVLQRKFNLDSQTYYSKPNYAADKDGAANIDAEKSALEAKQQEVADAQMKVDQLEAKLSNVR